MPGYVTKLKKIIKILSSQEKKGLLELSHMKAKNTKKITVFSKDNYEVQKFLI